MSSYLEEPLGSLFLSSHQRCVRVRSDSSSSLVELSILHEPITPAGDLASGAHTTSRFCDTAAQKREPIEASVPRVSRCRSIQQHKRFDVCRMREHIHRLDT